MRTIYDYDLRFAGDVRVREQQRRRGTEEEVRPKVVQVDLWQSNAFPRVRQVG